MKVVILAGGFGTRLAEETDRIPKPMVEIGGRPILWHIMKHYAHYGFDVRLLESLWRSGKPPWKVWDK
jgi:glucose-1-phosphate cytidylyltransferase